MPDTLTARAAHRRMTNPATGHTLRVTRWGEGSVRRTVFRALEDGQLVELGHVVHMGARLCMAYPVADGAQAFAVDSYVAGARALDERQDVVTLTLHSVQLRTDSVPPVDPSRIDADASDLGD